mmetsp:Transcript_39950/g.44637  ORF Transcript_39950/g.44637 Transcript_39950/m.44637 type:complete len:86 (-) Transcript_39950:12-269(-)
MAECMYVCLALGNGMTKQTTHNSHFPEEKEGDLGMLCSQPKQDTQREKVVGCRSFFTGVSSTTGRNVSLVSHHADEGMKKKMMME